MKIKRDQRDSQPELERNINQTLGRMLCWDKYGQLFSPAKIKTAITEKVPVFRRGICCMFWSALISELFLVYSCMF